MKWTDAQQNCIDTRGGTLLVSAAAGSGKTAVLVERVIARLADKKDPIDIDRLLIVTFTQAAAAEMKQRLAKRLASCLQDDPDNGHLARQQMLLPSAQISTIDGFCTAFLRENFEAAGVSPRFSVADANAVKLLKDEALDETLEIFYAASEDGFLQLCKILNGSARNDRNTRERILRIYEAIQAQSFPQQWLQKACAVPSKDTPLLETVWGRLLREHAKTKLLFAEECAEKAVAPLATMEQYDAFYGKVNILPPLIRNAVCVLDDTANDWDACKWAIEAVQPPKLNGKKHVDPLVLEPIEAAWDLVKAVVKELKSFFANSETEEKALLSQTVPTMQALVGLVETFTERFAAKKRERGWLDFNDLEHFTLQLLCDEQTGLPTALARETAVKYTEIYVDEYQDTNEAQDTIFRMLGCETNTAFLVGDVKQSIYGFRQANPQIFLDKKSTFAKYDGKTFPACITLDKNFRSREEVTGTVNFVCNQVMTAAFCGIDYRDGEQLEHGAADVKGTCPVEILLADDTFSASELKAEILEARLIAERVEELLKNGWVTDKDAQTGESITRPVQYKDICILLRDRGTRPISFANALREKGIPVQKDKTLPLFAADEVGMALSFLRAVDNPLLDIPLMAVMVSATVGFTADECAQIRVFARKTDSRSVPLYTALLLAEQGDIAAPLREKITAFLLTLRHYRRLAATVSAEEFINRLYDDTGMLLLAAADTDGAQKVANLRGIVEMARGYEQNGFRGLSAFLRYVDRMEAEHPDMEAPHPAGQANAVSIMTIHGSKGLEFPIVILANMTKKIREDKATEVFSMHNTAGAAICAYAEDVAETQKTAAFQGVELAKRYTDYAEEARLLYVALTRAKDKLICVYADYRLQRYIAKLATFVPQTPCISTAALMEMGNVGEWLLAALLRHPDAHLLRHLANATDIETLPADTPLEVKWLDAGAYLDMDDAAKETEEQAVTAPTTEVEPLFERISYRYDYAALGSVPVKMAASELAHRDTNGAFVAVNRPAFLNEKGLTPAEKGTALHTFMQFADFAVAAIDPEKEADRLYEEGFIGAAAREVLDMCRIRAFFEHPLYARMCKADAVWREYAFTVPLSVAALDPALSGMAEETLIVQGIADCVFEENGELVIVDYKTDRVKDAVTLRERYQKQLDIYRDALQQTLGKPVKEAVLYAFYLNDTVEI